jgi:glycosyltransferase involved in cell wall biosynthesis
MRVALLLTGIHNNPGGAERFFGDLFDYYSLHDRKVKLYLFCDRQAWQSLRNLNRLNDSSQVVFIPVFSNRFKHILESFFLLCKLLVHRIDLLHCVVYGTHHYHLLRFLKSAPNWIRPFVTVNIENLNLGLYYGSEKGKSMGLERKYGPLLTQLQPDGVFCWYESFRKMCEEKALLRNKTVIGIARYCFSDTTRFVPAADKENLIVFAGRMIEGKRADLFVNGVAHFINTYPEAARGWRFAIYGEGPLQQQIDDLIVSCKLQMHLRRTYVPDLAPVYGKAKCFVSMQDDENFTSLAMLEAMSAGCCIIARNVGQTAYFLRDSVNGFLLKGHAAEDLSEALYHFVSHPEKIQPMGQESRRIAVEEHTPSNFADEIEQFWFTVAGE